MAEGLHVVCPDCAKINRLPRERLGGGAKCGACGAALFAGRPIAVDARLLDRHISRNDIPLVVDFWAAWCGPCRTMAPAFEEAARLSEPRARFAKLDTEAYPQAAAQWGIRGIPTVIVFQGGHERARSAGAMDAASLRRWLEPHLAD
jgi:thioredoxin 2